MIKNNWRSSENFKREVNFEHNSRVKGQCVFPNLEMVSISNMGNNLPEEQRIEESEIRKPLGTDRK